MMRRVLIALAALCGLALPALAQDVVRVSVGGELAERLFQTLDVPVTVDMRQAPGRLLGGYRLRITWDPAVLAFNGTDDGNFAPFQLNSDSVSQGMARITAILPAGRNGVITLFNLRLFVLNDSVVSPISIVVDELTQAGTFADLLPITQVTGGTFCRSLGRWGDTNDDGRSDSRDALIALSRVVGLIDTVRFDTLSTVPLVIDTTRATLADVDADGAVTSRDALIILSHAVGLPVTGFRIGITAAAACGTGSATTLVILPDTIDLEVDQKAAVLVQARDAAGRAVATPSLIWRSTDPNIAAPAGPNFSDLREQPSRSPIVVGQQPMAIAGTTDIEGRGPGTATLTAELAPGIRATMVVNVVGRRRVWLADVRRALNATTQTGTARHPFGSIKEAVDAASNGDTIRIAAGTYQDQISDDKSVALLGDSTNRPVIDPRGSPFWSPGSNAIFIGNAAGKATLAHLVVRDGYAFMQGHDNEVRSVRFDHVTSSSAALSISSEPNGSAGAGSPGHFGNVLIDSVEVDGSSDDAIYIDRADTVVVRNSTVTGASVPFSCSFRALSIFDASLSLVHDNRFTNLCAGIEIQHGSEVGRAVLSRNVIRELSGDGIRVTAPVVRLDHNVVRDIRSQSSHSSNATAIRLMDNAGVDSLSILGDSIVNVARRGLFIDSARIATIDSLIILGTGQDSGFGAAVTLGRGRYDLRHSRIRNVVNGDAVVTCEESSAFLRGNFIENVTFNGVATELCFDTTQPDSLSMSRDTILGAGQNGISVFAAKWARIDSVRVDSAGQAGVRFQSTRRASLTGGDIRRTAEGAAVNNVDTLTIRSTVFDGASNTGIDIQVAGDSARLSGNTVNASTVGIRLQDVRARLDSNRITNNTLDGLVIESNAAARVTRSRFSGNGLGVRLAAFGLASSVHRSIIAGNVGGNGVQNDAGSLAPLDADTNFWGDAAGPACRTPATGCGNPASADSVLTTDVTFANHLTAADPVVPAPPAIRPGPRPAAGAAPITAGVAGDSISVRRARTARPTAPAREPWTRPLPRN